MGLAAGSSLGGPPRPRRLILSAAREVLDESGRGLFRGRRLAGPSMLPGRGAAIALAVIINGSGRRRGCPVRMASGASWPAVCARRVGADGRDWWRRSLPVVALVKKKGDAAAPLFRFPSINSTTRRQEVSTFRVRADSRRRGEDYLPDHPTHIHEPRGCNTGCLLSSFSESAVVRCSRFGAR